MKTLIAIVVATTAFQASADSVVFRCIQASKTQVALRMKTIDSKGYELTSKTLQHFQIVESDFSGAKEAFDECSAAAEIYKSDYASKKN